ncbi:MAG: hybrid sensor histidine kinase/response regulator [Nitrospirae bacterium]|nr:hybrid sensor histidine kinase/response regulator [Nitrospirota bacterium]
MKILIIEDEKRLAGILKQGLEENSFAVDLSYDGEEGLYMGVLSPGDYTDISLSDCIHEAVLILRPLAGERRIRVITNVGSDITVEGDRDRLTEAFLNIIENGVKYSNENGLVEISASRGEGKTVVSVRDSGTGMKEKDIERIYDRFFRADSSRGSEGTGLGLSIAKAIVEAHGGEIRMESEWKKGSTCTVVLPEKRH